MVKPREPSPAYCWIWMDMDLALLQIWIMCLQYAACELYSSRRPTVAARFGLVRCIMYTNKEAALDCEQGKRKKKDNNTYNMMNKRAKAAGVYSMKTGNTHY
jgi:hypothetical protein